MRKKTEKQAKQELVSQSLVQLKPRTRGELLDQRVKQLQDGDITARELADELKLDDQQFKFCELYCSPEYLGDGIEAVKVAYAITEDTGVRNPENKTNNTLKRLMKHQGVITLINAMLHNSGYSVEAAKKALGFLVTQHADKKMMGIAAKIILEAEGKLKREQEITVKHQFDYSALSTEELLKMKAMLNKAQGINNDIIDITPIEE